MLYFRAPLPLNVLALSFNPSLINDEFSVEATTFLGTSNKLFCFVVNNQNMNMHITLLLQNKQNMNHIDLDFLLV